MEELSPSDWHEPRAGVTCGTPDEALSKCPVSAPAAVVSGSTSRAFARPSPREGGPAGTVGAPRDGWGKRGPGSCFQVEFLVRWGLAGPSRLLRHLPWWLGSHRHLDRSCQPFRVLPADLVPVVTRTTGDARRRVRCGALRPSLRGPEAACLLSPRLAVPVARSGTPPFGGRSRRRFSDSEPDGSRSATDPRGRGKPPPCLRPSLLVCHRAP